MKSLYDIALNYSSNKNKFGLIDIYPKYFEDFRTKKFNLLEIGIDNGDSLRIWKDYFPNSHICGIDIIKKDFIIDNVDFYFGDQSNISFLKSLTDKVHSFDIIIDDGSHKCKDIITSFNYLYPFLNNGGFYVIEDLQTSYFPRYGGSRMNLNKKTTSMNFFKKLSDCVNYEHNDKPFFSKNKFDGFVSSVCFHQNICFVKKGLSKNHFYPKYNELSLSDKFKKFISFIFN